MITFRPPCARPLHPIGAGNTPPGEFRVTRSFNDLSMPQHGAHDGLDIGNGRVHDPILAMAPGVVTEAGFRADAGGAAIVRIDHGNGWSSGYAHMDRIDVVRGQPVAEGTQVGILGSTGWVTGAHLHFDITRNGVRLDPWPLLTLEEDMKLPDAGYFAVGKVGPANRLRIDHTTTDGSEITATEIDVALVGIITGGTPYTLPDGRSGNRWYVIRRGDTGDVRQVAHQLVTGITPTQHLFNQVPLPVADCSAQEATIAQLNGKIARARTANAGAIQAQQAVAGALA